MPRHHLHRAGLALLGVAALYGCTTADLAPQARQPSLAMAAADDPVLPDTVDVTPAIFSLAEEVEVRGAAPVAYAAPAVAPAIATAALAAGVPAGGRGGGPEGGKVAARSPELDALIARYADHHEIPVELLRRVVRRESTFDPAARNGPYWGLMQVLPQTARTMGYDGPPEGLLDAETNLKYAGRYLRGAYITAGGDHELAVRYYARGYYYDAKRQGLLEETGLGRDRRRMRGS